jgi:glycosyltransferase involved in cell wall biosynthesis
MPRPTRILIASQPPDAGVPRHVLDIVLSLDPAQFTFDVACPPGWQLWTELAGREGIRLHPIAPHRRPAPADGASLLRLARLVRQVDIVHAHSSKAGFLGRLAARLRGRAGRCVFTPHGWSFWAVSGAERRLYLSLERAAARWCSRIVAVSAYERDDGLRHGVGVPAQYRVIHNGVELRRFAAPPRPVPGRVLMVGRFAPPKRPDLAIRAFARVAGAGEGRELWLAGDGPQRGALQRLAGELGLDGRVRFLGTRDDIPELLQEASCLVLPSDYEACPVTALEGSAAGVPVVASRVAGVPEVVSDGATGLLAEPGSVESLASCLAVLLDDAEAARRLGEEGRRAAERQFSRERMVEQVVGLYRELLDS